MPQATVPAGQGATPRIDRARPPQHESADRAPVDVPARDGPPGQRQRVAAGFSRDAQLDAGSPPFRAVSRDAAAARRAGERHEMGQFVPQGPVHLGRERLQPGIERHGHRRGRRQTGGTAQPPAPAHHDARRQCIAADAAQQSRGGSGQLTVRRRSPWSRRRGRKAGGMSKKRSEESHRGDPRNIPAGWPEKKDGKFPGRQKSKRAPSGRTAALGRLPGLSLNALRGVAIVGVPRFCEGASNA
jgi:hypothetical protein